MSTDRGTYSRYQVLCAEREAWHDEESVGGDRYYYDGISFWRLGENGKTRLLPSWRTPAHGWRHEKACACDLCTARRPVAAPLSVA